VPAAAVFKKTRRSTSFRFIELALARDPLHSLSCGF